MKKINKKLYDVDGLVQEINLANINVSIGRRSVPELMDPMLYLEVEVFNSQHARIDEKYRLRDLFWNGNLDEAERQEVKSLYERLMGAFNRVKDSFNALMFAWTAKKIQYEKDLEIQERDKRVSYVCGKLTEKDGKIEELEERCERAENWWWWEDWKPKVHDFEGLKEEFVDRVSLLIAMESAGNHVRKWCWHRKIERVGGVNIAALGNEDLIEWVANEYLWKKLPDGMREKICASKDRRAFSLGAFKKKRQRLGTYVNAPTRSKNDRHREGVPMAREVDGA